MKTSVEKRIARQESAFKARKQFDETYKDAMKYTAQHRETYDYHTPGEKKYDRIYDSTGLVSVLKFASTIQSGLVPPFKKWARLVPGADIPEANREQAQLQLNAITDTFFKYLHSSNFDTQISESFIDLAYGTGVLLLNEGEGDNPFHWTAVPLAEVSFLTGPFGRAQDVFRRSKMRAANIKGTWPKAKIFKDINATGETDDEREIEVLESTCYNPKTKKYDYYVDDITNEHEMYHEEMSRSPWIIFRWSVMPGEIMGRGPALYALPDIKTSNKVNEILLQAAALKSIPTFMAADDGVINPHNIEIGVGKIIPCAAWGPGGPPLRPLDVGGDVNLSQFVLEKLQARIEDMMFTNPLGDVNLPVKSATEQSLRAQELANRIGSAFGRMHFECVTEVFNSGLALLDKNGLLPVSLKDITVDGKAIKIAYQSPIAQAQDEEEVINGIRYVQTMAQTVGPQFLPLFVDLDAFNVLISNNMGVEKLRPDAAKRQEMVGLLTQLAQNQLMPPAPPAAPAAAAPPAA